MTDDASTPSNRSTIVRTGLVLLGWVKMLALLMFVRGIFYCTKALYPWMIPYMIFIWMVFFRPEPIRRIFGPNGEEYRLRYEAV
jgi:hypothetical protein